MTDGAAPAQQHCDHLVLNEGAVCWVCNDTAYQTYLMAEQPVTSGECHAIRLKPCGHIVGDLCFEYWMDRAGNIETGLCPFCQQLLARSRQSPLSALKKYYAQHPMSHIWDMTLLDVMQRRQKHWTQWLYDPMWMMVVLCALWVASFIYTVGKLCFLDMSGLARMRFFFGLCVFPCLLLFMVVSWNVLYSSLRKLACLFDGLVFVLDAILR
jgi:hypothetical protein